MNKLNKLSLLKITALVGSIAVAASAFAVGNTSNITVTAAAPYLVNLPDYSADFTVDDYKTLDPGAGPQEWSIWTNSPGSITVTVTTDTSDATHAYMKNSAYTDAQGQNKVPFEILYQPCKNTGAPIDITPKGGQMQFQLPQTEANQQACGQSPGMIMVQRPSMTDIGAPLMGDYQGKVTVTIQQPV